MLDNGDEGDCNCDPVFDGDRLVVDAGSCPHEGRLADSESCRATVVGALAERDAESVVVRLGGAERIYPELAVALLVAAGRFVDRIGFRDQRLAERARADPLGAARDATARVGPAARVAAETGLAAVAEELGATGVGATTDYERAFRTTTVPTVAEMRVDPPPTRPARLCDRRTLETDAVARIYETGGERRYHLRPVELDLDCDALGTLAAAYERLAEGTDAHPDRAPARAVRAVADPDDPVPVLTRVLEKHARGYGVLTDFFADPRVSDVYATAPVEETPLRAVVDGTDLQTNVTLTEAGARALASRLRRESGRAFSRASPTLDATARLPSGRIRVAGVTDPVADGVAFAFRDHGEEAWTLPRLVANGTMPADAAALLSLAVERDAAILVAGSRGAGKTTTLGAMLWELAPSTRTLVVEDTPELPVERLQEGDRDVQALRTTTDEDDTSGITPTEALRTALRLGDSALVVGEVRGEEAQVLYEAMRVGASDDAVLGTIHGDGAEEVRERVTTDLDVPVSSFAATDLVVTLAPVETPQGTIRRIEAIEEVVPVEGGVRFGTLYELDGTEPTATGLIRRGESHLATGLTDPGESYAELLEVLARRRRLFERLVESDRTRPEEIRRPYAERSRRAGQSGRPEQPGGADDGRRTGPGGRT